MSDIESGVADRIHHYWAHEPEHRRNISVAATALAIKMFVSSAVERATSGDETEPATGDLRRLAKDLLRATDRLQYLCGMATGLLYTCVIPQKSTRDAQQWAARQYSDFRRTERHIDDLVHDMATQSGPASAAAAAKLVKLLAKAAWADPRMTLHGYHLMEVASRWTPPSSAGSQDDCPNAAELNSLPSRLDSADGSCVQLDLTHRPNAPATPDHTT